MAMGVHLCEKSAERRRYSQLQILDPPQKKMEYFFLSEGLKFLEIFPIQLLFGNLYDAHKKTLAYGVGDHPPIWITMGGKKTNT